MVREDKPKVAFICVHNSCRSQIAEALGKHFAGNIFESYSAGTETKPQINQDAVRLMKELYGIDATVEFPIVTKFYNGVKSPDVRSCYCKRNKGTLTGPDVRK